MEPSRKRERSRSALDSNRLAKRTRRGEAEEDGFTDDEKFLIAHTAAVFKVPPESLAAAITNLQKHATDKLSIPRKYKPRPVRKNKMPRDLEKADELPQRSHPSEHRSAGAPINRPEISEMPSPWHGDINEQRPSTIPRNSRTDDCLGFNLLPSMVADCLASFTPYDQDSNYEQGREIMNGNSLVPYNNAACHSEKHSNISSTSINLHTDSFHHSTFADLEQAQQLYACDDLPFMDSYPTFTLSQYPLLQATQPISNYQMDYPSCNSTMPNFSDMNNGSENLIYLSEALPSSESEESHFLSPAEDIHHENSASAGPEDTHSPNRPRRGPVDRVQTAQTRQLAACVRCKMQRIRCIPDPLDPKGVCITCKKVSKPKLSKTPCLRYRITDARLFKQGYLPGRVWTTRFQATDLSDIENWYSSEVRTIQITYDYSPRPLILQVRKFKPQEGDMLHRSWKHGSAKKSVELPPYAIASFGAAEKIYKDYINQEGSEFYASTIDRKNGLLWETMSAAIKASDYAMTEPERALLKMVLRLWVAGRLICRSERICGPDTLGLPSNLIDETNPWLHGKIPIPPVMGAQIDLIVTSRILAPLRAAMLEKLQKIILANKPENWFCIYLCIFILLHNCALMTQQDTAYAKKHGLKTRFAMIDLVEELHYGANILLGYFHYCTKGFHPFSLSWKAEQTLLMAKLNTEQVRFVKKTAAYVKINESRFREMFEMERYDDDLYFVAQMYEEDWKPRQTKL